MKIFLDTANVAEIKEGLALGVVDGVTTNPSLIAKEKRPFRPLVEEICSIVPGDVSLEVVAIDFDEMVKEGEELAQVAPNAVVKVPLTQDGLKAVKHLSGKGIRLNQTLCFSAPQALLSAKAGSTYISPFLGRLDDIGHVGMDLIRDICEIYRNYGYRTQVLAASIRGHDAVQRAPAADEAPAHGHRPQEVPGRLGEVGRQDLTSGREGARLTRPDPGR
jgi:transaldolase